MWSVPVSRKFVTYVMVVVAAASDQSESKLWMEKKYEYTRHACLGRQRDDLIIKSA